MLRHGSLQRRQISFDIDTKVAEQILGPSYRNIYRQIYDFMLKEGWVHLQGSVYMSKKPDGMNIVLPRVGGNEEKYEGWRLCGYINI